TPRGWAALVEGLSKGLSEVGQVGPLMVEEAAQRVFQRQTGEAPDLHRARQVGCHKRLVEAGRALAHLQQQVFDRTLAAPADLAGVPAVGVEGLAGPGSPLAIGRRGDGRRERSLRTREV